MKSVLVISYSRIESDPRVMRQIAALQERYEVKVVGFGPQPSSIGEMVPVSQEPRQLLARALSALRLCLRRYEAYYWNQDHVRRTLDVASRFSPDLTVANDVDALPIALKIAQGRPVVLDAHEYAPKELEDDVVWRLLFGPYKQYLCARYLPQAASMMTVGDAIAQAYCSNFGVMPEVVRNAPPYVTQDPSPVGEKIQLIHPGGVNPSRRLESLLEMMPLLDDRFELDLMLMLNNSRYSQRLQQMAMATKRVRLIPPVPMPQISSFLNRYDIGVYSLPPNSFNNAHALPNKFFEFVQGRLAVAVGPTPEMAGFTKRYDLGVVAEDFSPEAMARALNGLSADDVRRFKQNAHLAASELCYEHSKDALFRAIDRAFAATRKTVPEAF